MLDSQQIINPFILFCHNDEPFLDQLCAFHALDTPPKEWQFKLKDLYLFLLHYYQHDDYGFKLFRRELFNSPVNQRLSEHGYTITIAIPATHVDDNLYALLPLAK
jgi:hypothetical protein